MFRIFVILVSIFSLAVANAQTFNTEQTFKQKLERVSQKNKTIHCDFTQTKKVKNIKQPIISKGEFFYDNSGLMALIFQEPKGDKVVMKGESFYLVVSGKKMIGEASNNPMMSQISNMMQACMSGNVSKLGRGWQMMVDDGAEGGFQVNLTPTDRRVRKYLSGMIMYFDGRDLTLDRLRIEESSGGFTEYHFLNKKLNQAFDHAVFNVE